MLVKLRRVELLMKLHLRAVGCDLPYGMTSDTSKHSAVTQASAYYSIYLPRTDGRLSWPRWPRWLARPQMVTHPTTNPAAHSRELNSQSVDHKSDALTTTLPSHHHRCVICPNTANIDNRADQCQQLCKYVRVVRVLFVFMQVHEREGAVWELYGEVGTTQS